MKYAQYLRCACVLFVTATTFLPSAFASEESDQLEALQRALKAPDSGATSAVPAKKTGRTRAIVFENNDSAPPPPAVGAPDVRNCATTSPDALGTAVGFSIQFASGKADIAESSEPLLAQIAKVLSLNPSACIVVEGHTDISGNADMNTVLSRMRAESVVKYLGKSTDQTRLIPVGRGSSQLLKNLDPRNPKNRRVVFKVVA
ncbi:MAG: OmpA family protein [Rhodoferax sp.]|nr:OmpA family protein [Rhodoferax sp.]